MGRDKTQLMKWKVSVVRRRIRWWNESERWMMIMLRGRNSLEEKEVGGEEAACDYSAVSSVDNFHILECHSGRGTSQERQM